MRYMQDESGFVFQTDYPESHKNAKPLTKKAGLVLRKEQSRKTLLTMLKPGQTVFTVCRSVSSSGMSRRISLYIVHDGDMRCLDHAAADVTGYKNSEKGGLTLTGCGTDMGFHLVETLGRVLWPDGTPEPHGARNGEPDSCGGYALKHRWV